MSVSCLQVNDYTHNAAKENEEIYDRTLKHKNKAYIGLAWYQSTKINLKSWLLLLLFKKLVGHFTQPNRVIHRLKIKQKSYRK